MQGRRLLIEAYAEGDEIGDDGIKVQDGGGGLVQNLGEQSACVERLMVKDEQCGKQ